MKRSGKEQLWREIRKAEILAELSCDRAEREAQRRQAIGLKRVYDLIYGSARKCRTGVEIAALKMI